MNWQTDVSAHSQNQVQVKNQKDCGGKDLWKRWGLNLEQKAEGVADGDSKDGDCDEVICAGWGEQEESEQNEVDGMKKGADSTDKEKSLRQRASMPNGDHPVSFSEYYNYEIQFFWECMLKMEGNLLLW